MVKLIVFAILFAHWSGCIHYIAAELNGFEEQSWVVVNGIRGPWAAGMRAGTALALPEPLLTFHHPTTHVPRPTDASVTVKYTWAFFMALSHMLCIGYGRHPPQTVSEIWITIFSMVIGASLYAIFIGQISSMTLRCDSAPYAQPLCCSAQQCARG